MERQRDKKLSVMITGATGMVGEGVLHECLGHDSVDRVLVIGRRSCGVEHPKLAEIILPDLRDISPVEKELSGWDACFFCLGASSVGMGSEDYFDLTYTLTLRAAGVMCRMSPGMTFCYVSGAGTDGTEKGRLRWARVKGKTENDLMKLPFKEVYAFRPAFIIPTKGLRNTHGYYRILRPLLPLLQRVLPGSVSTLKELGLAMINVVRFGYEKKVLEVRDIIALAGKA